MHKKDCIRIATLTKKHLAAQGEAGAFLAIKSFIIDFSYLLKEDNKRFDREQFLTACGIALPNAIKPKEHRGFIWSPGRGEVV